MNDGLIEGVELTPLKIISINDGDVMHGMKSSDDGYYGFGEAYFSEVKHDCIKAWKKHNKMISNLIVPIGAIKFVIFDDREMSSTYGKFQTVELSKNNYQRLTIGSGLWLGFMGNEEGLNMLLNISDIPHDPEESDNIDLNEIEYKWR